MRQSNTCRMRAPTTGDSTGPTTNMTCTIDRMASRFSALNASLTTAMATALTAPAPSACTTRNAMSISMSSASAQSPLAEV